MTLQTTYFPRTRDSVIAASLRGCPASFRAKFEHPLTAFYTLPIGSKRGTYGSGLSVRHPILFQSLLIAVLTPLMAPACWPARCLVGSNGSVLEDGLSGDENGALALCHHRVIDGLISITTTGSRAASGKLRSARTVATVVRCTFTKGIGQRQASHPKCVVVILVPWSRSSPETRKRQNS